MRAGAGETAEKWGPCGESQRQGQGDLLPLRFLSHCYNCLHNSIKLRGEKRGKGFHWPKEDTTLGKCEFCGFEVTAARSSGIFWNPCF